MKITGGVGEDSILMAGGAGNDIMTYTISSGADLTRIYGAEGDDSLTINKNQKSFTLHDGDTGQVLFTSGAGGSTITVYGVEHIRVIGDDGSIIYER
jgi:hypothetical protein